MTEVELARWVGRTQERQDWVTPSRIAAWDATFDYERPFPNYGDPAPPGFHWALFPPLARNADLGTDGHARTGTFLPPSPLPRRMWAGSRIVFHQPLKAGERVEQKSVITAVEDKQRPGGRLVFVTVRHLTSGARGVAVEEEQDLVYREAPTPPTETSRTTLELAPEGTWRRTIHPTETLLFRYSALTFNGHRIHYDRRYAETVEGYPGLVVHGPLVATLLLNMLQDRMPGAVIERFRFKARRPAFDISPFNLHGTADDARRCRLWSTDNRGQLAMEAEAWIR